MMRSCLPPAQTGSKGWLPASISSRSPFSLSLLVLLVLSPCAGGRSGPGGGVLFRGSPEDAPLRVMSFNIRYGTAADGEDRWEMRRDLLFEVVRAESPDVLCLQEALRSQIDELLTALPDHGEVGVGRDDGLLAGEHASILYRRDRLTVAQAGTFWFSETPEVPGSMDWGNRITRICTWARLVDRVGGGAGYVFNLHLDHQSQPSRERSAGLLLDRVHGRSFPDPVIVTGDFNAGEGNLAVGRLLAAGYRDTFREIYPDADGVGTFNSFRGETGGEKIDHILVDGGWQVLDAEIVRTSRDGRYPSDHFPVSAVLRLVPDRDRVREERPALQLRYTVHPDHDPERPPGHRDLPDPAAPVDLPGPGERARAGGPPLPGELGAALMGRG